MKIDITQDALLRTLVEAMRDQRDHGEALMRLMLRLVNETNGQGWFETHWRTEARLKLVQLACGDMPKDWQSAASAFDVIAEAARLALKAQNGTEGRATLLAIGQLIDAERSMRTSAVVESRATSEPAPRRKAKGTGKARRRATAPLAKAPGSARVAKARPTTKSAAARKAVAATKMSKSRTMKATKTAGARVTKARIAAKPAAARKANGAAKVTKTRITAKPAAARKVAATKASKSRTAQPAKTAATKVTKARIAAKPAAAKANGQMPANQTLPAPASAL